MTKLPLIDLYTGQVPDKANMDKDTFANSVYTYLNYFNDKFIPQSRDWADNVNTLSDEMQTAANNAATSETNAQNYELLSKNYANADKNVEVENGLYSAKHWALFSQDYQILSKNYANADKNVEVENGLYSAKHWALKAQEAVAALPEGTIDDNVIDSTKAWSSQKISDELSLKLDTSSIDDSNINSSSLWSSQKISDELSLKLNTSSLDDTSIGSNNLWSSQKISDELGLKEDLANKGQPNGYAELDENGQVPKTQLPNIGVNLLFEKKLFGGE